MHYPRFNPTRVRLERGRRSGRRRRRAGFNPTRVRLEHVDRRLLSRPARFNPTRVRLEPGRPTRWSRWSRLQPHKGASGTVGLLLLVERLFASTPQGCVWNGQERRRAGPGIEASTPQGCVWNTVTGVTFGDLGIASTPQGCVWNERADGERIEVLSLQPHKGASGTPPRRRVSPKAWSFNPTRVRLEHGVTPNPSRPELRFNPTRVRLEPSAFTGSCAAS